MRSSTVAIAVLLLAAASGTARAQASPVESRLPERLAPATRQAIVALADSLERLRVPSEGLYAKAAEGVLKGADDARILVAVRRLARELRDAREALGAEATPGELMAGANALHAGVPAAALRELRAASTGGTGELAVPIVVLVDLVTRRVPADVAARSISTLIARRASDADFHALRTAVDQDIRVGAHPADAAAARARAAAERLGRVRP